MNGGKLITYFNFLPKKGDTPNINIIVMRNLISAILTFLAENRLHKCALL